ncbi:DUF455 family protein [Chengkuizengella axinellae]|uniref:DUF455 family protein n=1 Tax=Chengkuizengella axinellae TaxID=3064388 RepID=A0ABT9IZK9_9BACL|nr:DUF455 family protein [Chengkuizengella sp. 2205SS18-9]MDP5274793.1 DUF455 family protein [Chengkuizengella sp. 2205SS18-9]
MGNSVEENIIDRRTVLNKHADQELTSRFLRPIDTASLLKNFMWQEFELSRMGFGWLLGVPDYDNKSRLGRYGYIHSKNSKCLYERVKELPGNLKESQGTPPLIEHVYERLSLAPSDIAFYISYDFILKNLDMQYAKLRDKLDPILDAPTIDQLNIVFMERKEIKEWLHQQIQFAHIENSVTLEENDRWLTYIKEVWQLFMEGLNADKLPTQINWPEHPTQQPVGPAPAESAWNAEELPIYTTPEHPVKNYSDPDMSPLHDSIKQMHYINATEIGAAQMLCYLYYGVRKMPLAFYYDLARHLWDEVRHSQMGFRRLEQMGYSTQQFKFPSGSPGKDLEKLAKEWFPDMYCRLTMIGEPCSFIKKRKSAEKFWEYGDDLSAIHCEFDMADERMHVDYGKKWGPELYKQINDLIQSAEMAQRMKMRRLEELGAAATKEEREKIAKNFPAFCGFSTMELNYEKY